MSSVTGTSMLNKPLGLVWVQEEGFLEEGRRAWASSLMHLCARTLSRHWLYLDPDKIKTCTSTSRPNLHYEIRFISDENDERFFFLLSWLQAIYACRSHHSQRQIPVSPPSQVSSTLRIVLSARILRLAYALTTSTPLHSTPTYRVWIAQLHSRNGLLVKKAMTL